MADQEQNSAPPKCANGCGFFGDVTRENLCSRCFKDIKGQEAPAAPVTQQQTQQQPVAAAAAAVAVAAAAAVAAADASASPAGSPSLPKKKTSRCGVCNVKLGMLGFECRCEGMYCSKHRFADQHSCDFDFKSHDRQLLAASNPQIVNAKIQSL